MQQCRARLSIPWTIGGRKYRAGDQCHQQATEKTRDGVPLCWVHARREARFVESGYTDEEKRLLFPARRYVPG